LTRGSSLLESTISRGQLFDEGIAKELTFFAIMMKAPRPPMLLARADEVIE